MDLCSGCSRAPQRCALAVEQSRASSIRTSSFLAASVDVGKGTGTFNDGFTRAI
jgi:hypothetical protein